MERNVWSTKKLQRKQKTVSFPVTIHCKYLSCRFCSFLLSSILSREISEIVLTNYELSEIFLPNPAAVFEN